MSVTEAHWTDPTLSAYNDCSIFRWLKPQKTTLLLWYHQRQTDKEKWTLQMPGQTEGQKSMLAGAGVCWGKTK